MGLELGLRDSGGLGRWPSAPLGGGTGPQPPGPEGVQSAGKVGRPNGAPRLCGGFQEEEMEEQIAKAEWWSSEGASPAPLQGVPAHHLLPGVSQPPSPCGEKPMGEG